MCKLIHKYVYHICSDIYARICNFFFFSSPPGGRIQQLRVRMSDNGNGVFNFKLGFGSSRSSQKVGKPNGRSNQIITTPTDDSTKINESSDRNAIRNIETNKNFNKTRIRDTSSEKPRKCGKRVRFQVSNRVERYKRKKRNFGTDTDNDDSSVGIYGNYDDEATSTTESMSIAAGIHEIFKLSLESNAHTITLDKDDDNPVGSFLKNPIIRFLNVVVGTRNETIASYVTLSGDWVLSDLTGEYYLANPESTPDEEDIPEMRSEEHDGDSVTESEQSSENPTHSTPNIRPTGDVLRLCGQSPGTRVNKKAIPLDKRGSVVTIIINGSLYSSMITAYTALNVGDLSEVLPPFENLVNYKDPQDTIRFADLVATYMNQNEIYVQKRNTHFIPLISTGLERKKIEVASYFQDKYGREGSGDMDIFPSYTSRLLSREEASNYWGKSRSFSTLFV